MVVSYAITFIAVIFTLLNLVIIYSLMKTFHSPVSSNNFLKISVVVAAKNESENISNLIESLKNQKYPEDNFEVIFVDDNSSDDMFNKTNTLINDIPNFRIIKAAKKTFEGKKGALDIGINNSNYPFIMITDADCNPEPGWLNSFAKKFGNGYDFIFGIAPFFDDKSLAGKIACFENLRTSILTFAAASLGIPYSAAARSFGFKKDSFINLKGYSNTIETLSGDDDLLLREAVKNELKIGTVTNFNAFVYSKTKRKIEDYIRQKARHTTTSFYYLMSHKIMLGFWHLYNLVLLFSPLLIFVNKFFIILFLIKLILDLILVSIFKNKFGYKFNFFEIIFYQIIYEIFIIINFFTAKFMKVEWK